MKMWCVPLTLAVLAAAPEARAQTAVPPEPSRFTPSLYVLGSIDESSDVPFGGPNVTIGEASPAGNVGASLDFAHEAAGGRLRGSLFALVRSPLAGSDRSFFGAGRVEASRRFGHNGRLTFTDGGKVQIRPQLHISDYWGNAATLRAEWNRPSGRGFGIQIADRRRSLPELQILGFSLQSIGLGFFFPVRARGRAELSADAQRYSATTATGGRLVLGGELAVFTRNGIATLRVAWFEPFGDRRRPVDTPTQAGDQNEFGDIGRAEFFETLALQGGYGAVLGDAFFLDPLESDSDEWDFGRRKQVLTAFVSRRLGARTTAASFIRVQHKRGPNLLLPKDAVGAASFADDRVAIRSTLRYQMTRHVSLLLQASYVKNWSDHPNVDFYRLLGAVGVQIQY